MLLPHWLNLTPRVYSCAEKFALSDGATHADVVPLEDAATGILAAQFSGRIFRLDLGNSFVTVLSYSLAWKLPVIARELLYFAVKRR